MTDGPLSDIIEYLPYILAAALVGLYAYVEYLRGRIEAQSKMIGIIIQSINRLEERFNQK
jgi:hypothetical protein